MALPGRPHHADEFKDLQGAVLLLAWTYGVTFEEVVMLDGKQGWMTHGSESGHSSRQHHEQWTAAYYTLCYLGHENLLTQLLERHRFRALRARRQST